MEELFGGGSHRPLGGCRRSGTEKVAAEGVGQKKVAVEEKMAENVAAAGIVGKANPKEKEKEEKEEDIERDNIAEETEGSF